MLLSLPDGEPDGTAAEEDGALTPGTPEPDGASVGAASVGTPDGAPVGATSVGTPEVSTPGTGAEEGTASAEDGAGAVPLLYGGCSGC